VRASYSPPCNKNLLLNLHELNPILLDSGGYMNPLGKV
jgi:hypothetical protein